MERSDVVEHPTKENNAHLFNVSMHKYITYNLEFLGFHAFFDDFNNNNNLWTTRQRFMHI